MKAIHSPAAASTPVLRAAGMPRFCSCLTTRRGTVRSRPWGSGSGELSSTITISAGFSVCASIESIARRIVAAPR
jgi:hypothetical protein